jgi:recombination protein RecA
MRTSNNEPLSSQMKALASKKVDEDVELDGNFDIMTSTGSTLLDLAISGCRVHGGGLPGGILVEGFGPSQSGKTTVLSEIAGNIQRSKGDVQFHDPEARLDQQYFAMYGVKIKPENYYQPDTVTEVFKNIRKWEPETSSKRKVVHGIFADSLAALSTDMEMKEEEGDKMGMRRAKEFSEQLRKTCRVLKQKNFLLVASNQVRVNTDAVGKYSPKYSTPGGEAVKFYSSVRLKFNNPEKIYKEIKFRGKTVKKAIGVTVEIEVVKTVDKPFRKAPLTIIFDYGIDNIRDSLQYIKDYSKNTTYCVGETNLGASMEEAIKKVESMNLEKELREEVITLWELIDSKFQSDRKPKH